MVEMGRLSDRKGGMDIGCDRGIRNSKSIEVNETEVGSKKPSFLGARWTGRLAGRRR